MLGVRKRLAQLIKDRDYQPPDGETPLERRLREAVFAVALVTPCYLTAILLTHVGDPAKEAVKRFHYEANVTAFIVKWCAEDRKKWSMPNWRDPECKALDPTIR